MALLIRWIFRSYLSYFGSLFVITFSILLLLKIDIPDHSVILILFLAEGLINNQILKIQGLACQLITKTKKISFLWLHTNAVIMVIFNTIIVLVNSIYADTTELQHGLMELNFYLIPLLSLGNHISNSRMSFSYTVFRFPVVRLTIYYLSFSVLFLLNGLLQNPYLLFIAMGVFIIIYLLTYPRQDSITLSYELYKRDIGYYA